MLGGQTTFGKGRTYLILAVAGEFLPDLFDTGITAITGHFLFEITDTQVITLSD